MTCADLRPGMEVALWDRFHRGHFPATVLYVTRFDGHEPRVEAKFRWLRTGRTTVRKRFAHEPLSSIAREPAVA